MPNLLIFSQFQEKNPNDQRKNQNSFSSIANKSSRHARRYRDFLKCAPNISIDLFTSYLDTFALYRVGKFEFDMSRNFQIL